LRERAQAPFDPPPEDAAKIAGILRAGTYGKMIAVMPGSARLDLQALKAVAADFGWTVKVASDLRDAASAQAVLFHRDALGAGYSWLDAVQKLRRELPGTRLIACHGLSEAFDWPQLSDAGAFHALGLPLRASEIRQSLGFLSAAEKRLSSAENTLRTDRFSA
jgi:hypothetical protein